MAKHPIDSYLKATGKKKGAFARTVRCSGPMMSMIIKRRRRPSPELALRIERKTDGAITIGDLFRIPVRRHKTAPARKREAA